MDDFLGVVREYIGTGLLSGTTSMLDIRAKGLEVVAVLSGGVKRLWLEAERWCWD